MEPEYIDELMVFLEAKHDESTVNAALESDERQSKYTRLLMKRKARIAKKMQKDQ